MSFGAHDAPGEANGGGNGEVIKQTYVYETASTSTTSPQGSTPNWKKAQKRCVCAVCSPPMAALAQRQIARPIGLVIAC